MKFLLQDYLRYGLIMSGVVAICLAVMEFTGQNKSFEKSPIVLFFTTLAPAIIWYLGIAARKKLQKGKLTFKQGLSEGFKISLVFGVTSPFVFLFYYLFVNPEILEFVRNAYKMSGASDATVIITDMVFQLIGSVVMFGLIYSTVLSVFLRSKNK